MSPTRSVGHRHCMILHVLRMRGAPVRKHVLLCLPCRNHQHVRLSSNLGKEERSSLFYLLVSRENTQHRSVRTSGKFFRLPNPRCVLLPFPGPWNLVNKARHSTPRTIFDGAGAFGMEFASVLCELGDLSALCFELNVKHISL